MTAELFLGGWDLGGWDRVLLPGLTAALVSFVLILWNEWRTRRRKHAAFWHAINAELKFSGGLAESVFAEPVVEAPLYRLPRSAFETCYPQLLADGALSAAEKQGSYDILQRGRNAKPRPSTWRRILRTQWSATSNIGVTASRQSVLRQTGLCIRRLLPPLLNTSSNGVQML